MHVTAIMSDGSVIYMDFSLDLLLAAKYVSTVHCLGTLRQVS